MRLFHIAERGDVLFYCPSTKYPAQELAEEEAGPVRPSLARPLVGSVLPEAPPVEPCPLPQSSASARSQACSHTQAWPHGRSPSLLSSPC